MGSARRLSSRLGRGLAVGAAASALALALWLPGLLDSFEATTFDVRARLLAKPGKASGEVVTILLDQYSLTWAQDQGVGWPWPRSLYGMVADYCARAGAKALVFDVLFSEETNEDVGQDEALGSSIKANGRVVAAVNLAARQGQATAWPEGAPRPQLEVSGLEAWKPRDLDFSFAQFPIPTIANSALILANTNLPAEPYDGVYRREPLFASFAGHLVPSEALAAWMAGGGSQVAVSPGRLRLGSTEIPIDSRGRAILRWRGKSLTHAHYTAAAILNAEKAILEGKDSGFDPVLLKDKYVFFGFSAPGLLDLKPTPMAGSYPGVEVNATMLDNLLSGDFLAPFPLPLGAILLVLLSLAAALAVTGASGALRNIAVYALFLALPPALGLGAYALGWWFPVVPLLLGTLLGLMASSLASYATEGKQKRYLKSAFRQYMNHAYVEQLIAHPEILRLGGERRELTIFFSDVQGFTSISESLSPEDLTALLNEYLSAMTDIIEDEGGTIDKYEGDAIIAFWNAPIPFQDHAVRGLRAALRCQEKLAQMRPSLKARIGRDLYQRIGMNTGAAVVGNMGSRAHFNYTMLGDQVNLAARLEGVNKQFGTYTMVSEALVDSLGGAFPMRELSRVGVVGREKAVRVFEPMMAADWEARKEVLGSFARGLALFYEGDFEGAARIFSATAQIDPPSAAYLRKCTGLMAEPEARRNWQGVWVMTEK